MLISSMGNFHSVQYYSTLSMYCSLKSADSIY